MAPDQNTTTTLDMLLQQGLEITPEGRCTRHPDVLMLSKDNGGGIISCQSCALEQKKQEEDISVGVGVSLYSKMVSSLHDINDNLSSSCYSDPTRNNYVDRGTTQMNGINSNREAENSPPMDDGLETLIARWCQLQDVSGTTKPSSDMLSTTLILLQLQKLERRVFHQEKCIQNLQANIQEQQSDIQSDLTQILTFIATAANSSSASRPSNVFQSYRQKNPRYQQDGALSPTSGPDTHPVNPQRGPSQRSLYQKHRDPKLHPSSHFTSVRTIERQPPKPPKRHDSFHSLAASLVASGVSTGNASGDSNSMSNTNTNHTNTNTINEDQNRVNNTSELPGRPQPVMVSSLSDSTLSTSISSRSFNVNHWGINATTPSAVGAASTGTNGTATTATTATGGATRPSLLNAKYPLKPKNSFRNPTGPQLEIIWDASEHTQAQAAAAAASAAAAAAANGDTTAGSRSDLPSNPKDVFTGKGALPKLTTCLDDGDDDDDESSKYKSPADLFLGMKTYMSKAAAAAAAAGPNNHDSCFTSAFQSFAGEATSTEDGNSTHDDDTESDDDGDMTVSTRESNVSTRSSNISSTRDDNVLSAGVKVSKKEKKLRKKEQKKEKKEKKKEKKEKKKQEKLEKKISSESNSKNESANSNGTRGSTALKNNKVSPDDQPVDENKSRKSRISKSIFWKRSGKKKQKSRESSPIMPRRRTSYEGEASEEFCVVNDNPRTHSLPAADAKTDIQVEPVHVDMISDIPLIAPREITPALGDNSAREGDDLTVKTPLTAQTPQAPNERKAGNFEPPPPPQTQHNRMQQQWHHQRRAARASNIPRAGLRGGNGFHPPSPPPRRRGPFPRTHAIMPTLVNSYSKRDIVIGTGESSRMQISTLTLDTALPSADAGSVLQEVTNQSLKDKINERGTYTGTINELEEPEGYGTMIYNSGAFYKGEWKEGHWHGEGILRTPSGDSYEGEFVYDCRHGRGIYKYENGDVYEGDFSSDKRHGKGTFLFQNGSMYRGDFAYGNFHGYGWYEFEEGYYEGSWADGNYEGIGTLTYRDGSHYTGRFKGGVADGLGEELKPDGTSRRGMWKSGEFLGQQDDEFTGQQQQGESNVVDV